nr:MAG TPA: hypothetical protein [Caudoviricetes sp.]
MPHAYCSISFGSDTPCSSSRVLPKSLARILTLLTSRTHLVHILCISPVCHSDIIILSNITIVV